MARWSQEGRGAPIGNGRFALAFDGVRGEGVLQLVGRCSGCGFATGNFGQFGQLVMVARLVIVTPQHRDGGDSLSKAT
jgi:hypothetical protein